MKHVEEPIVQQPSTPVEQSWIGLLYVCIAVFFFSTSAVFLRWSQPFTSFEIAGRTPTKPQRLAAIAESLGSWGRVVQDPVEAMEIARRTSSADEIIVVTGSTFIVAEIREWWLQTVVAA